VLRLFTVLGHVQTLGRNPQLQDRLDGAELLRLGSRLQDLAERPRDGRLVLLDEPLRQLARPARLRLAASSLLSLGAKSAFAVELECDLATPFSLLCRQLHRQVSVPVSAHYS
jgi:hypothetical protein